MNFSRSCTTVFAIENYFKKSHFKITNVNFENNVNLGKMWLWETKCEFGEIFEFGNINIKVNCGKM